MFPVKPSAGLPAREEDYTTLVNQSDILLDLKWNNIQFNLSILDVGASQGESSICRILPSKLTFKLTPAALVSIYISFAHVFVNSFSPEGFCTNSRIYYIPHLKSSFLI